MKVIRGAAVFASVVVVLSGCAFGGSSAANATTLDFLAATYREGAGGTKSVWEGVIADFHEQHPDITVNLQMEPWTSINDVVRNRIQSRKTTPDLLNLDSYASFARDGLLYEAGEVLPDTVLKDFSPVFAGSASIDGRQYGLPLFASTRALFYNKDLFARAKLNTPPKNWGELLTDAHKLQKLGGGVVGYGLPLGPEEAQAETTVWTYGAGGSWSGGTTITANSQQNLDGVSEMRRLVDQGVTQPNPADTNRKDVLDGFIEGRIGMIEGLPPTVADIAKRNPNLKYATAPSPTRNGSPVTLGVADHLMAFTKDRSKREAIQEFLEYFYSPEVYSKFVRAEGFIAVTNSGLKALEHDPVTMAFASTLPSARFYPDNNPKWPAVQSALRKHIGAIAQGVGPHEALQQIQTAADSGE